MDEELRNWRVFTIGLFVFLSVAAVAIAVCSYHSGDLTQASYEAGTVAETARITACVENGGQWLRVENTSAFECRRA